MDKIPVVTIDGPSSSGKGTVGAALAKELGWHFLDSGAFYRKLALAALQKKIPLDDEAQLVQAALNLDFTIDPGIAIRTAACSEAASKISVFLKVREALLARQREFCRMPGLIADGRDMGTVVFPDALCKIFLEASVEERAKRRFLQLKEMGLSVTLEDLLADMADRDARDRGRVVAPLKAAEDAVIIDTTALGTKDVIERIKREIKRRLRDF